MAQTRPPSRWVTLLHRTEELILGLLLATMILLACLQIVLRMFFNSGLHWIDPLLPYLVLWCGFLGAVAATGKGKHITLDVLSKNFPRGLRRWLGIVVDLFSAAVTAVLAWASYRFIVEEYQYNSEKLLTIPLWAWNTIFCLAFVLMCARFLFAGFKGFRAQTPDTESRGE